MDNYEAMIIILKDMEKIMYRVFCDSYKNYISQYEKRLSKNEYRFIIAEPIMLIINPQSYFLEKQRQSVIYKQLSDLLAYIENNPDKYPELKAFLWTLESRGIKGENFGITPLNDLEEQVKLIIMFLDLLYWDEVKN